MLWIDQKVQSSPIIRWLHRWLGLCTFGLWIVNVHYCRNSDWIIIINLYFRDTLLNSQNCVYFHQAGRGALSPTQSVWCGRWRSMKRKRKRLLLLHVSQPTCPRCRRKKILQDRKCEKTLIFKDDQLAWVPIKRKIERDIGWSKIRLCGHLSQWSKALTPCRFI